MQIDQNGPARLRAAVPTAAILFLCTANLPGQAPLHTFAGAALEELGYSVAAAGDVDDDGYDDLIVGAPGGTANPGYARVCSGLDGSILFTFTGDTAGDEFGAAVSGAGDVDGDGHADLLVGAASADNNGGNAGMVRLFAGADGSVIATIQGDAAGDEFGFALSGVDDVNGDGFDDFAVTAPGDDNVSGNSGSVRVYSGRDRSILHTFDGAGRDSLGSSVDAAGDVNRDGYADVVAGAIGLRATLRPPPGYARVFSGIDGAVLHSTLR